MNFGILPDLTKTYILDRISQEAIMEKYLAPYGVTKVQTDRQILSPFRKENNPSCGFYYNSNGKLRIRDLGGSFWGDCFDVVAWVLKVNANNKKSFQLILHTIAKDFRIHKYVNNKEVTNYDIITKNFFTKRKTKKPKLIIKVIPRKINYHDVAYWKKFNINELLLNIGRVYFAEEIYISRDNMNYTQIYSYSTKDPAYCYYGGKTDNIDDWKIYYPFRPKPTKKGDKPRFHSNSSFLQGKHLITCGRIGIITKAYKDVLSFRSIGLQAVAPSAESILISQEDYWFMKNKFDFLISCMDYDTAGIRMMKKLYKHYRIQPFMLTNGTNNTVNYGVKDFAEQIDKNGVLKTKNLINNIYKKYLPDFEELDTLNFNTLKFIQ